ncbi:methyl-accepting chemotaxis protein [Rugamonas sp. CCM 8940]|uniref:methyl-accepting chemotaxis protein n=1 Tax=Rugamonas sp. CCM 8940 TaxID=2765359 RepID=UPI0018F76608|nr:methyl-accepting chemotaxis protein [Rugamonas sp. CCM 8940]MBJ7309878.1 MCP four helix bundle domain-containing protein [Rugamonas sp. CCM 8940]
MKFADLKIGMRLGGGFGLVMLLMVAMAAAGIWRLQAVGQLSEEMVGSAMLKERLTAEWHNLISISGVRVIAYAKNAEQAESKAENDKAAATRARVNEIQKQLEPILVSAQEKTLLDAVAVERKQYAATRDQVFKLKKGGDADAARKLVDDKLEAQFTGYLDSVEKIGRYEAGVGRALAAQVQEQYHQGQSFLLALAGGALLLGSWFAYVITHSITAPLHKAVRIAQTVAAGDLSSQIDVRSRDEAGMLLQALKEMNASLVSIVGQVRGGTDTIATASSQIASGNLDLSSRTEQQASSLQQTASSMEQLTATVKQNGDNSRQAHTLALSASEVALKGGDVVNQVVDTMGMINESAHKIVDIITVIDGIAFQTNILALNAAVEAARAGEQGRGFAVVATEVRNLAQRSAAAAKEIKTLISDSVEKVELGARLVDQAGRTMKEIVVHVRHVTDIIGEITTASTEQTVGIEQVNHAIAQMDQVTQQNAALVEEAAAAAAQLQQQSQELAEVVSVFQLSGKRTLPTAPAGAAPARLAMPRPQPTPARKPATKPVGKALALSQTARSAAAKAPEWEEF